MNKHSSVNACCIKKVCNGCDLAATQRRIHESCPFCRTPVPSGDASKLAMIQKRVDMRDAEAICSLGYQYYHGRLGLAKDVPRVIGL